MLEMEQNATLKALQESSVKFYLTGSRFFRTAKRDSDYDFFAKDDAETESLLLKHGFIQVFNQDGYGNINNMDNDLLNNIANSISFLPAVPNNNMAAIWGIWDGWPREVTGNHLIPRRQLNQARPNESRQNQPPAPRNQHNVAKVFQKDNIHIQLVKDPQLKLSIQDAILKHDLGPILRAMGKQGCVKLWDLFYELATMVPKETLKEWFEKHYAEEVKAEAKILASKFSPESQTLIEAEKVKVPEMNKDVIQSLANNLRQD